MALKRSPFKGIVLGGSGGGVGLKLQYDQEESQDALLHSTFY